MPTHSWLVVSNNVGNGHIREVNLLVLFCVEWVARENLSHWKDLSYRNLVDSESWWCRWRRTSSFRHSRWTKDDISIIKLCEKKKCSLAVLFMSFTISPFSSWSLFGLRTRKTVETQNNDCLIHLDRKSMVHSGWVVSVTIKRWALHVRKPSKPIDKEVKTFVKPIFNEEKKTGEIMTIKTIWKSFIYPAESIQGRKTSIEEYIRSIRTARKPDESKRFVPFQYLTHSQVNRIANTNTIILYAFQIQNQIKMFSEAIANTTSRKSTEFTNIHSSTSK